MDGAVEASDNCLDQNNTNTDQDFLCSIASKIAFVNRNSRCMRVKLVGKIERNVKRNVS